MVMGQGEGQLLLRSPKSRLSNKGGCVVEEGTLDCIPVQSGLEAVGRQQHVSLHLPHCTGIAWSWWCVLGVTSGGQLCLKGHE